jgi:molecular chaperone DnaK (HSP70)
MSKMQLDYMKSVLLSQLLLEANEGLRLTTQFKQNVKQQVNKLNVMLEDTVREEYNNLYNTDPQMVTNILNKIESLVDKIKGSSIDELVMIDAIIDKYQDNKDWFKEHAEAEFLKID